MQNYPEPARGAEWGFMMYRQTKLPAATLICLCLAAFGFFEAPLAQQMEELMPKMVPDGMDNTRPGALIGKIDPEMTGQPGRWQFRVSDLIVNVITDERAERMRIMIPIRKVDEIQPEEMYRVLQANFDSALDARYAVAKGILWSTYIHPLSALTDKEFLSGLGQAVNIVVTYGRSYSSGVLTFGGGDSTDLLQKELLEELMKKGDVI